MSDGSTCNVVRFKPDPATRVASIFEDGHDGAEIGPLDRLTLGQELSRKWRRHVRANEFAVLTYIFDRTIGWGKPSFRASIGNILDGSDQYAGLSFNMSRRTLMRCLSSLQTKGMITRTRSRDYVVLGLNLRWSSGMLNAQKRPHGRIETAQNQSRSATLASKKCHTGTQNNSSNKKDSCKKGAGSPSAHQPTRSPSAPGQLFSDQKSQETLSPDQYQAGINGRTTCGCNGSDHEDCNGLQPELPMDATAGVADMLAQKQDALTTEAQTRAKTAKRSKAPNSEDFLSVWNAALSETYPEAIMRGANEKTRGQINRMLKSYGQVNQNTSLLKIVDWAIRNWQPMIRQHFGWMKDKPTVPELNFFLADALRERVIGAYMTGGIKALSQSRDVDAVRRYELRGLTREEALARVGQDRATEALRREMEEIKTRTRRRVRIYKDRAEKAEAQAAAQPVTEHPDSPRNVEARREVAKNVTPDVRYNPMDPTVKQETWEELQARLARERQNSN